MDSQNIVQIKEEKFEKEFCKKLPESLLVLSNQVYADDDGITEDARKTKYPWMPNFSEDIRLNKIESEIYSDDEGDSDPDDQVEKK